MLREGQMQDMKTEIPTDEDKMDRTPIVAVSFTSPSIKLMIAQNLEIHNACVNMYSHIHLWMEAKEGELKQA